MLLAFAIPVGLQILLGLLGAGWGASSLYKTTKGTFAEREGSKLAGQQQKNQSLADAMLVNQRANERAEVRRDVKGEGRRQEQFTREMSREQQSLMMFKMLTDLYAGGASDLDQGFSGVEGSVSGLGGLSAASEMESLAGMARGGNPFRGLGIR